MKNHRPLIHINLDMSQARISCKHTLFSQEMEYIFKTEGRLLNYIYSQGSKYSTFFVHLVLVYEFKTILKKTFSTRKGQAFQHENVDSCKMIIA